MDFLFFEQLVFSLGLIGLFAASLIANAALFIVTPIDLIVVFLGSTQFFHPLVIGIVAGLGGAFGEMSGYIIGLGGRKAVEKSFSVTASMFDYAKAQLNRYGVLFVFFGALTPFPFDFIGLIAGVAKYNWKKFFIALLLGKVLRYILLAYAGLFGMGLIKNLFLLEIDIPFLHILGAGIALALIAFILWRILIKRRN